MAIDQPIRQRNSTYSAEDVLADCKIVSEQPVGLDQLENGLAEDGDLRDHLDARYGCELDVYRFQLITIPIKHLSCSYWRNADIVKTLEKLCESDRQWESYVEENNSEPDWIYEDAQERLDKTKVYINRFRRRQFNRVPPLVIDLYNFDTGIDLIDGYHRLGAAIHQRLKFTRAYHLLPDPQLRPEAEALAA